LPPVFTLDSSSAYFWGIKTEMMFHRKGQSKGKEKKYLMEEKERKVKRNKMQHKIATEERQRETKKGQPHICISQKIGGTR
jgi:hypothetical protein